MFNLDESTACKLYKYPLSISKYSKIFFFCNCIITQNVIYLSYTFFKCVKKNSLVNFVFVVKILSNIINSYFEKNRIVF